MLPEIVLHLLQSINLTLALIHSEQTTNNLIDRPLILLQALNYIKDTITSYQDQNLASGRVFTTFLSIYEIITIQLGVIFSNQLPRKITEFEALMLLDTIHTIINKLNVLKSFYQYEDIDRTSEANFTENNERIAKRPKIDSNTASAIITTDATVALSSFYINSKSSDHDTSNKHSDVSHTLYTTQPGDILTTITVFPDCNNMGPFMGAIKYISNATKWSFSKNNGQCAIIATSNPNIYIIGEKYEDTIVTNINHTIKWNKFTPFTILNEIKTAVNSAIFDKKTHEILVVHISESQKDSKHDKTIRLYVFYRK